nr:MAG TPA: protein of unknown function (DUF5589) [Bacteriophage sp.]
MFTCDAQPVDNSKSYVQFCTHIKIICSVLYLLYVQFCTHMTRLYVQFCTHIYVQFCTHMIP